MAVPILLTQNQYESGEKLQKNAKKSQNRKKNRPKKRKKGGANFLGSFEI